MNGNGMTTFMEFMTSMPWADVINQVLACMGSQAWRTGESQVSNAKCVVRVKCNTSMHQAITVSYSLEIENILLTLSTSLINIENILLNTLLIPYL